MAAFDPLTSPLEEVQQKLDKMSCPADVAELEYYLRDRPQYEDLLTRLVFCVVKTREILEKMQIANHGFKGNPERKAVLTELAALRETLEIKQREGKGTVTLEKRIRAAEAKAEKLKYAPGAGSKLASYTKSRDALKTLLGRCLKKGFTKQELLKEFPEIGYVMKGKI